MKTYVFFANTMAGISGGPIYVRNKMRYLKEIGWNVVVIDNTAIKKAPILLEEFNPYSDFRFCELLFPPFWFTKFQRKNIINKILTVIGPAERYVIESTQIILSEWAEILASELNAKHLIYLINENDVIKSDSLFEFLSFKYDRNELFTITPRTCINLFSRYSKKINLETCYWNAGVSNTIENYEVPRLSSIPKADFNIGYFGRYKQIIPYVCKELREFCLTHPDIRINFIVLGFDKFNKDDQILLRTENLNVINLGELSPIPKLFFDITDVIIASAGCASISYKYGARVITMSVEKDQALGILGYTTEANMSEDGFIVDNRSLSELLSYCFKYASQINIHRLPCLKINESNSKGYSYQLKYVNDDFNFYPTHSISYDSWNLIQLAQFYFVKLGLAKVVYYLKKIIL